MNENAYIELNQLLTPTEAARAKGMRLNKFKYHASKIDAPKAVVVGKHRHPYYVEAEIAAWQPCLHPQKGNKKK